LKLQFRLGSLGAYETGTAESNSAPVDTNDIFYDLFKKSPVNAASIDDFEVLESGPHKESVVSAIKLRVLGMGVGQSGSKVKIMDIIHSITKIIKGVDESVDVMAGSNVLNSSDISNDSVLSGGLLDFQSFPGF
jgi:hypothetical protein